MLLTPGHLLSNLNKQQQQYQQQKIVLKKASGPDLGHSIGYMSKVKDELLLLGEMLSGQKRW
jgi:hypothetical protein